MSGRGRRGEEEVEEERSVWPELSVCLRLDVSPVEAGPKGRRTGREGHREKRGTCLDPVPCHVTACGTLTDHRLRLKRRREGR